MAHLEVAHTDPLSLAARGGYEYFEFDEPLTVALAGDPAEFDVDPAPTIEEPLERLNPTVGTQSARALEPGCLLGKRYRIEQLLGVGGSAAIFSAIDLHAKPGGPQGAAEVALKVLHPELRHEQPRIERLMREFNYMRRLLHPAIARVLDLQCDAGIWFMVMERLQGRSLSRHLSLHPQGLPASEALRILTQCTEALLCAHREGVCHGDLKPGNVLITDAGQAYLIDFGAVPNVQSAARATLFATPAYASPQLLNQRIATPRDDLFSLGCLAYELFAGHHPFGLLSSIEARRQRLSPQWHERIPRELFDAIRQLLAWEREGRQADALEFLDALAPLKAELKIALASDAPVAASTMRADQEPPTLELSVPVAEVALATRADEQRAPVSPRSAPQSPHRISSRLTSLALQAWQQMNASANAARRVWHSGVLASPHRPQVRATRIPTHPQESLSVAVILGVAVAAVLVLYWSNSARIIPRAHPTVASSEAALRASVSRPIAFDEPVIRVAPPVTVTVPSAAPPRPAVIKAKGRVWLTTARVHVAPGQTMAAVNLRRDRSTQGAAPVSWSIAPGTAKAGVDFEMPKSRIARFNDGQDIRTVFIKLKPPKAGKRPERRFTIKLQKTTAGPDFGPITQTEVVIGASG